MSERALSFSDENLLSILPEPRCPRESCDICKNIPFSCSKMTKGGELQHNDIPGDVGRLQRFLSLGEQVRTNWLEKCPTCDRLYYVEESYEFLINGSEDYSSYREISREGVLKLAEVSWARKPATELHGAPDGTWAILTNPKR